jgi:enoyl-CoA hydratase/carnithine racemase
MSYEHIRVELRDAYAEVTLAEPKRRNALSFDVLTELWRAFERLGESEALGVMLSAEGPVFSAGHDFADMAGRDLQAMRQLLRRCTDLMQTIQAIPQPVLARVHGLATAAGCQLVASCDLAVASSEAGFATPGGKGGWFCTTPMIAVGRAVGRKRALEMLMTGDTVDAETAADWGAAWDLLRRATRGSPLAKGIGKQAYYATIDLDQPKAYAYAVEVMAASALTEDGREQMRAFLEKRRPVFRGK